MEAFSAPPRNLKYIFACPPRRARVFHFCNANLVKFIESVKLSVLRFVKWLKILFLCNGMFFSIQDNRWVELHCQMIKILNNITSFENTP